MLADLDRLLSELDAVGFVLLILVDLFLLSSEEARFLALLNLKSDLLRVQRLLIKYRSSAATCFVDSSALYDKPLEAVLKQDFIDGSACQC